MQQPTVQFPIPPPKQYIIRYTSDCLLINDEPVNYGPQILDLDKLYIIKTGPQSKLQTPIVIDRTREVDELDRKIFFRTFLLEIVKGMEISGFEDAAFILQRVPKLVKYFVGIVQKVSLARWIQLLGNDSFFLVLYQTLEQLISNRQFSQLRTDFIQELIQVHLKAPYARIFFLLENLLLENENLRNSMVNLARQIVMKEIEDKWFFEVHLLGVNKNVLVEESENEILEDNRSETDSIPQDKEMAYPEKFLYNSINVIKSCQKIKITKETIIKKITNPRFFKILKYFFQGFFERQKLDLLEILALASQIQPMKLWKFTFDQGRTTRCKTLLFLESLITNSMLNSSDVMRKPRATKKLTKQSLFKINKNQQQPQPSLLTKINGWSQFASIIIQKFITISSPERKVFLHKILNTLLMCRSIEEELDLVMMFLETSARDQVYVKKNVEVWRVVVKKLETWLRDVMAGKRKKESRMSEMEDKESVKKIANNNNMSPTVKLQTPNSSIICQQTPSTSSPYMSPHLPIPKLTLIKMLKIYKLLITHEQKFQINLDPSCLMYLVDVTEKSKGVIEGVRMSLIEVLGKKESLIAQNVESDGEDEFGEKEMEGKW